MSEIPMIDLNYPELLILEGCLRLVLEMDASLVAQGEPAANRDTVTLVAKALLGKLSGRIKSFQALQLPARDHAIAAVHIVRAASKAQPMTDDGAGKFWDDLNPAERENVLAKAKELGA